MRFGLGIPTCREGNPYPLGFTTPAFLRETAAFGEAQGFYSLWADDHLVSTPAKLEAMGEPANYYEPLTTFAHVAAITTRVRLMTATIVPTLRDPVLLAKQAAVVDRLSGGRLILGMGLGGSREEFEAIVPDRDRKANRGKMLEEFVRALRQLLETGRGPFAGSYYEFGDLTLAPAPLQRPLPLYLSADVPAALERVGVLADGWIVTSVTPGSLREYRAILHAAATRAKRAPDEIETCLFLRVCIGRTEESAREALRASLEAARPESGGSTASPGHARVNLVGTPRQITSALREYQAAGVDHLGLVFRAQDHDQFLERAALFAKEVMPAFA